MLIVALEGENQVQRQIQPLQENNLHMNREYPLPRGKNHFMALTTPELLLYYILWIYQIGHLPVKWSSAGIILSRSVLFH